MRARCQVPDGAARPGEPRARERPRRLANRRRRHACIAADLDDDGAAEVLTGGGSRFGIWDGRDGTQRWSEDASMGGATPLYVDVDDDGSTEVVWPFDGSNSVPVAPTVVLGHGPAAWPAAPPGWPAWDTDAGGGLRGLPVVARGRPDLDVAVVDACFADCVWGPVALTLQARNAGDDDAEGAVLTVTRADGAEVFRALVDVPAQGRADVVTVPLAAADAASDLVVTIDAAGDTCTADAAAVVVESPCAR